MGSNYMHAGIFARASGLPSPGARPPTPVSPPPLDGPRPVRTDYGRPIPGECRAVAPLPGPVRLQAPDLYETLDRMDSPCGRPIPGAWRLARCRRGQLKSGPLGLAAP